VTRSYAEEFAIGQVLNKKKGIIYKVVLLFRILCFVVILEEKRIKFACK
jgi:hypothetical protein